MPAYWNSFVYFFSSGDALKAYALREGLLSTSPVGIGPETIGFPGATPSISANGNTKGIVWAVQSDGYGSSPAILRAYDATNVAHELYNTEQNPGRDRAGIAVKFTVPLMAIGLPRLSSSHSIRSCVFALIGVWIGALMPASPSLTRRTRRPNSAEPRSVNRNG